MAISMISLPKESFQASIRGLNMWWEIVFPSLFPFFVISELLIGFGVVSFIGVLLEPLMRPIFRVPGVGGFAWAMGMATGFPAGAKLTARLREEGQLTQFEAERLVSFTNSSSPLFIFGAVSVGFFYDPSLGIILAIAHYLGNFCVGFLMRFHGEEERSSYIEKRRSFLSILEEAVNRLHESRIRNGKPLGKLLGDAIISSIQTLLMIGGFIILFSVINKLLFLLHITSYLALIFENILLLFQLSSSLSVPLIAGLFEITLGSQMTSQVQGATLVQQAVMTSFILAFSGFSVQAQVASILAPTDIRFKPYFIARIMHGFLAGLITFLIWKPIYVQRLQRDHSSTAIPVVQHPVVWDWAERFLTWFRHVGPIITIVSLVFYILIYYSRMKANHSK